MRWHVSRGRGVPPGHGMLAPPSPALPATDLLASLSIGGNKSATQPEWRKASGCCATGAAGVSWVPILPAALRGAGEATEAPGACAAGGTHRFPASSEPPAPAPLSLPVHKARLEAGQRRELEGKTQVGGARRSLLCFSRCFHRPQTAVPWVQPPPCPWSGDAKGSHSPGAGPPSRREKKTKQNRPGSKYYLNIKERDVSSYGSRISAF